MNRYVRKINNRWYYTIEDKDEQGNRKRHERFGGYTKAEAEKAYRKAMYDMDRTGRDFEMFVSTASRRRTTAMVR